jgi:hypothetical protein
MVVLKIDGSGICILPTERDAPASTDRHRKFATAIAGERVEAETWQVKVIRRGCGVQGIQHKRNLVYKLSGKTTCLSSFPQALQRSAFE